MDYQLHSFRLAEDILNQRSEWFEFRGVLDELGPNDIISIHKEICAKGGRIPAGGQIASNVHFDKALKKLGWKPQPRLFDSSAEKLQGWKMDFIKANIG